MTEIGKAMKNFYENFEMRCLKKGIAPSRACVEIGLSRGTAHNWKKMGNVPKLETLRKLAKLLDCDVMDLTPSSQSNEFKSVSHDEEQSWDTVRELIDQLDRSAAELIAIYEQLPTRQKVELMTAAYKIADNNGVEP